MTFKKSDSPQRSPEWVEIRVGKPSASNLYRWLAVSKRDGKPLQARKDYEAELAFEKTFNVPFTRFVTGAMEEGNLMEPFLKKQYEAKFGVSIVDVGCYYNEHFVASPDGEVGKDGLVECKWVYDKSFSDVLANGVSEAHDLQMQGQMWASGRKWCDYVVGNDNLQRFKVIRVKRNEETIKRIEESVVDAEIGAEVADDGVFEFTHKSEAVKIDKEF